MKKRLDNLLANSGYATRSEAKKLIRSGKIKVNGKVVTDPVEKFVPEQTTIIANGTAVRVGGSLYLMMNKPAGVVCAAEDRFFPTVQELLPQEYQSFSPHSAGRLDKDTEGFVLLSNDGELIHRIISPKHHVPKRYYAKIEGTVTEQHKALFADGITLDDGYLTKPAELFLLSPNEIELVIYEGKFHQVKRMFEAIGCKVTYLKRLEIGPLTLDSRLASGETRELTEEELSSLKTALQSD